MRRTQVALKLFIRLWRHLVFDVLHPDLVSDVAAAHDPVASRPQVLTPVAFAGLKASYERSSATTDVLDWLTIADKVGLGDGGPSRVGGGAPSVARCRRRGGRGCKT